MSNYKVRYHGDGLITEGHYDVLPLSFSESRISPRAPAREIESARRRDMLLTPTHCKS